MKNWIPFALVTAALGCGGGHDDHEHAHPHGGGHDDHDHPHGDGHGHKAPHGGVLVNVQDEFCHIEFVREPNSNRLQLHVMRFHPEGPLKISMAQIEVSAKVGTETKAIVFKPTELDGMTATTEPTSLYVAEVDWLEAAGAFDGTINELKIEGKTVKEITFKFAKQE